MLENVGALLSSQSQTRKVFKYILQASCFETMLPSGAGFTQPPGMPKAWIENVLVFRVLEERRPGSLGLISWENLMLLLWMCVMCLKF